MYTYSKQPFGFERKSFPLRIQCAHFHPFGTRDGVENTRDGKTAFLVFSLSGSFYDLGTALSRLGRTGEARLYFERVVSEFPKSEYAERAKRRLNESKA